MSFITLFLCLFTTFLAINILMHHQYIHRLTRTQKSRYIRIRSFEVLAENVMSDILEALEDAKGTPSQVNALIPLLNDVRKYGDTLLKQRKLYHQIFFPYSEKRLMHKIIRLAHTKNFIQSIVDCRNLQDSDTFYLAKG